MSILDYPTIIAGTYGTSDYGNDNYSASTSQSSSSSSSSSSSATSTPPVVIINLSDFAAFTDGSGYSLTVQAGQVYSYTLTTPQGTYVVHTIHIGDVTDDSVTLVLDSTPRTVVLTTGQLAFEDVTGDNKPDIGIYVKSTTPPTALLAVWQVQSKTTATQVTQPAAGSTGSSSNTGLITALIITAVALAILLWLILHIWHRAKSRKESDKIGLNPPPIPPTPPTTPMPPIVPTAPLPTPSPTVTSLPDNRGMRILNSPAMPPAPEPPVLPTPPTPNLNP